jgi:hypothetical protein
MGFQLSLQMGITPISSKDLNPEFLKGKNIALKSFHNTYVRSFPGGAAKVDLQKELDEWGTYKLIFHPDQTFSFQTNHGTFLRAWPRILLKSVGNKFITILIRINFFQLFFNI